MQQVERHVNCVSGSSLWRSLGHALKRRDWVNLHRAWMCFGLDGVALWGRFRAVPANDMALPRCARLFLNAFSQAKRR